MQTETESTKLLAEPYGWPFGSRITLEASDPARLPDRAATADVLSNYGCPDSIAISYAGALASGGPISCRVFDDVARSPRLRADLSEIGITISTDCPPYRGN